MQIQSEIIIDASPAVVWTILTDFPAYPQWNPLVEKLEGEVAVGNTIEAWLPQMKFTPTVLTFEKEKAFAWRGKLFIKGLFDGHHQFYLEAVAEGKTRFIHQEDFSGILVPLFKKMLRNDTAPLFEKMNKALKARAEKFKAKVPSANV
jgi:hypothetical protein